ncbi:MAG: hypothetical protein P8Y99_05280 [Calditrichaceae bacterium]
MVLRQVFSIEMMINLLAGRVNFEQGWSKSRRKGSILSRDSQNPAGRDQFCAGMVKIPQERLNSVQEGYVYLQECKYNPL